MSFDKAHLAKRSVRRILDRALRHAKLPETVVRYDAARIGNTRFANNGITTTGEVERVSVSVTASVDGRSATASGTQTDDAALRELVAQAEQLAQVSPPDPEHMPPLGPQSYPKVDAHDSATAKVGAVERAVTIERVAKVAKARGLVAAGFLSNDDAVSAMATSAGLFAFQPSTTIDLSTTFRTPDGKGSGYKAFTSFRAADLDASAIAEVAADKAERSRNPGEAEPGRYTVLLEAQAVADLLSFLGWSLSAREADEGRSFFAEPEGKTKVGQELFDERITLYSDPGHVDYPAAAFASDGSPLSQQVWIEGGKLVQLTRSRYWAQKTGQPAVPWPGSMHLAGGSDDRAALLAAAGDGVLVTRFHYNRMLESRSLLVTGLTRDGTFRVQGGKLAGAINNFRYNDSPLTLLRNVKAMGPAERVAGSGRVMVVPPMVVEGFRFASKSAAV